MLLNFIDIFIIALTLAADAFSVSLVLSIKGQNSFKQALTMSSLFGFFQFFMPILGFFLFHQVQSFIENYAHWIAFSLLAVVGCKMFWDGITHSTEDDNVISGQIKLVTALTLAFATSIDALAVGGSFATLNIAILSPAIIIGLVCFTVTALGMAMGRVLLQKKSSIGKYANIIGGIVLILIGCKIILLALLPHYI